MSARVLVISFQEKLSKDLLKEIEQSVLNSSTKVQEVLREDLENQPLSASDVIILNSGSESFFHVHEALTQLKSRHERVPVICLARFKELSEAVDIMKAGAFDYFSLPADVEKLKFSIAKAIKSAEMSKRIDLLERHVGWEDRFDNIIGTSPAMREIFQMIHTVSKSNATVLVLGESGTGKELVAKAIHRHSERAQNKFIDINCGAIPKELLENELFGHERGAFTGADRLYIGSCERAHGGTLFLDEISEMDVSLQVKILRVLQERTVTRIGGSERLNIDIRIIAATNKDLRAEVEKGQFREDLYYRLNVVPIHMPPLRSRRDDVPLLAQYFLEKYAKENNKRFKGFTPEAMQALVNYDWPGNVRELENNIERVVVLNDDSRVQIQYLPRFLVNAEKKIVASESSNASHTPNSFDQTYQKIIPLKIVEQYAIESAVKRCMGDVVAASKKLGIGQATLYRKIKRYGIKVN